MKPTTTPRTVLLLGSTGSVGTQAIDVVRRHPDRFQVVGLGAGGGDPVALAHQAAQTGAQVVAVADSSAVGPFNEAWGQVGAGRSAPEVLAGPDAATELAGRGADVVLNAITGSVGLGPTLAALRSGSTLALANKESLVVGGPLVAAAQQRPDQVVPVDSEHSAIWQCLRAGDPGEVRRLILTASGGPFRGWRREDLGSVTPEQALAHPTWSMGPVISVNSATLMNKGLELIEAHLLFNVPVDDIAVVVHPQSVVHSMVEFCDGSTVMQASPPDMRLPIALGLSWPQRLVRVASACDWTTTARWSFEPLDDVAFPALRLAREAISASPTHPAVYNAVNEEAVAAFLHHRVGFLDIVDAVERVLGEYDGAPGSDLTLDEVLGAEMWARERARSVLGG